MNFTVKGKYILGYLILINSRISTEILFSGFE